MQLLLPRSRQAANRRADDRPTATRLIAHARQQAFLERRPIGEQRARLVAVTGEDDFIEALGGVTMRVDHDVTRAPHDPAHRCGDPDIRQPRGDLLDVGAGAALHGAPLRPVENLQQSVVVTEAHERGQWKFEDVAARGRPDRRSHRQQIPVAERG